MPMPICIIRDGKAVFVDADYDTVTGDTLVDGRSFRAAYPASSPPYAAESEMYARNEPVVLNGRYLMKYGLPRVIDPRELQAIGEYRGLPMFVELGDSPDTPSVVYLPVRPGCEFHPYQVDYIVGAVRGK